jgi:hypothetical protein
MSTDRESIGALLVGSAARSGTGIFPDSTDKRGIVKGIGYDKLIQEIPMRATIPTLAALLLTGCAAQQVVFTKPGFNVSDFRRDKYECVQQSTVSWSGGGYGAIGLGLMIAAKNEAQDRANKLFKMCMEARGYDSHVKREDEVVLQ